MSKVFGYARVSTDDQANSAEAQERKIRDYAAKEGLVLEHIYVDEDVTGRIPLRNRPQGKLLWERMEAGDTLCFCRIDRVFRSMRDASDTAYNWRKDGIAVIILDLNINLSEPAGRLFFHQLASFAEFERELNGQRVREVKKFLSDNGRPHGNRPFGWRRDRPGKGASFVPCQQERELADRVSSWHDHGRSYREIALALYHQKVAKPGKKWSERGRGIHYSHRDVHRLVLARQRGYPICSRESLRVCETPSTQTAC